MTEPLRVRLTKSVPARHALVVGGIFEASPAPSVEGSEEVLGALERARERPGFTGRSGQRAEAETSGDGAHQVVLHGLGARDEFDSAALAKWLRRIGDELRSRDRSSALVVAPRHDLLTDEGGAEQLLRGLALLDYRFDEFKKSDGSPARIESLSLLPPPGEESRYRQLLPIAAASARGVVTTRDLANSPPNRATPAWMAERARELAEELGMQATVLEPEHLEERKMGGILAVGSGSANRPRLVRLTWGEGETTVALVGKGVTFDTGGISIKPAASMDEMKFDKSGACTVLGIARTAAELELPLRFAVYLPLAENMPDGASYRPGDIVRCYNGKTVEILNTDAEGRMLLADALAWASEERPDYLIDFATLTGACVVALGHHGAGLFAADDGLAGELLEAAESSGERLWRLPT
ncbi:MAG: leucyl aminopeptidase, partial [Thermoanaerobaculia bacterium]|nr:leucyl aminopeptidase [Thermoanaerobaculia bacterium]